ncbi:hypothetical protein ES703_59244 [subsurface metagenome]
MNEDRLSKQIEFLVEIDKLKTVFRNVFLVADPNRRENSAEHSWHTAMMALILEEYAQNQVDSSRLVKMMLIHDVIEVDAGDTNIYDKQASMDKAKREQRGAERIFSLLAHDQRQELFELWEEYEKGITPEAKFARALDRLIPLIHNYYTQGKRWKEDGITYEMALPVYQKIQENCPALWEFALSMINECVSKGYLPEH